jgi:hypothetical protein
MSSCVHKFARYLGFILDDRLSSYWCPQCGANGIRVIGNREISWELPSRKYPNQETKKGKRSELAERRLHGESA